ncbi:hypothetical protein CASFOL_042507 [Castilleja foliolosa]|uniref:Legume lectin domain-containing protein n=1 Tax=Castilleja foliolosa TaxID=1961234 RepID=A0ABD3BB56_9LAMI
MSTKNINSIIFLLIISIFPSSFSLSFNFSAIGHKDPFAESFNLPFINVTGDAYITDQGIQLTPAGLNQTGRATYIEPLHLWDRASRNLTDFTTHFSFGINSNGGSRHGDGLAFDAKWIEHNALVFWW